MLIGLENRDVLRDVGVRSPQLPPRFIYRSPMRKIVYLLVLALLTVSCAGPVGPAGPPGPQGERGPAGLPAEQSAPYDVVTDVWLYPDVPGGTVAEPQNPGAISTRGQMVGDSYEVRAEVELWLSVNDPGSVVIFVPEEQPDRMWAFDDYGVCSIEAPGRGWFYTGVAEWTWVDRANAIVGVRCLLSIDGQTVYLGKRTPWTMGTNDIIRFSIPFPRQ